MKREKKQQPAKEKEFKVNPFKALKGMTVEVSPSPPKEVKKEAPPAPADMDDRDLFFRAMADVQRIREDRLEKAPSRQPSTSAPPPARPAELFDVDDRRLFLETIGRMKMDVTFRDNIPVPGGKAAAPGRMRQLKRGTIRIDFELDLHGLTREEAIEALAPFIEGAYRRGQQAVLVITGKGNNSADGEPVLQPAVSSWLRDKGRQMVAEFALAPPELGGDGALVVFLRSNGKEKTV